MNELERLAKIGTDAVLELRKRELAAGRTFMINAKELPSTHAYIEYPDGTITIETLAPYSCTSFIVIRKLSASEAQTLRDRIGLK
jgi:hypothetical protein